MSRAPWSIVGAVLFLVACEPPVAASRAPADSGLSTCAGPGDAGILAGTWGRFSIYESTRWTFNPCNVEVVVTSGATGRPMSTTTSQAAWSMRGDELYVAGLVDGRFVVRGNALILGPYLPVGPPGGIAGVWARPAQPSFPFGAWVFSDDGGVRFSTDAGSWEGSFTVNADARLVNFFDGGSTIVFGVDDALYDQLYVQILRR